MPGPPPRDPARRARRNAAPAGAEVIGWSGPRPPYPKGLRQAQINEWRDFWASPLAQHVTRTDLPALRRLFALRDEAARAHEAYRAEPDVIGSMGQIVVNPAGKHALALDAAVRDLEDRFGLTPKARLALGVRYGQALDAQDRHPDQFGVDQEGRSLRADPRVADADAASAQPRRGGGGLDGGQPRPR